MNKGFTILEMIIFALILQIVLATAAAFVVTSLVKMKVNEHKMRATFYSEELKEWLNSQRESDFTAIQGAAGTYCINTQLANNSTFAGFAAAASCNACPFTGITGLQPLIFRRCLVLTNVTATQIRAQIQVSWQDAGQTYTETIESIYTSW